MIRTILNESPFPKSFRLMLSISHILNRVFIRPILKKNSYEIYFERKPNVSHFHISSCKYFVHNHGKDDLGKCNAKMDNALIIRYSFTSKAFQVYKKRKKKPLHVVLDESPFSTSKKNISYDQ